jgi:porin
MITMVMVRLARNISGLVQVVGIAVLMSSASVLAAPPEGKAEMRAASMGPPNDRSAPDGSQSTDAPPDLAINNPGSIAERLRRDEAPKEYLFPTPGISELLKPWYAWKAELDEKYGLRFGISATHLYQWASDTVGPEDDASGFDVTAMGTWTFLGRDTGSPTTAGFEFLYRDRGLTDIPPAALFTQIGSLYPTSVGFADISPSIGQLWIQQKFDDRFGFQVGKIFPLTAYDFFPFKNFKMDFVDGIHAANLVIPLPDRGLGGFLMYRPQPDVYLRLGAHDANADTESSGFNSLFDEGELFTIFEFGFDPGLMPREPGLPPFGDVHVSLWHQEERDDASVDDGWGVVVSGSQRFGSFVPFLRYGYADSGARGPTPIEHMVNGGVVIDDIFGRANDRIGVGLTWSRPSNGALDDQGTLDAFYRIQITEEISVTPIVQLIVDPARNPDEDQVVVLGIRTRFEF